MESKFLWKVYRNYFIIETHSGPQSHLMVSNDVINGSQKLTTILKQQ